jgi:hypothetical protein
LLTFIVIRPSGKFAMQSFPWLSVGDAVRDGARVCTQRWLWACAMASW